LSRSLTFGSFSDIVLEAADGVTFAAHKIVLKNLSKYMVIFCNHVLK
jgi:hypothetical protein